MAIEIAAFAIQKDPPQYAMADRSLANAFAQAGWLEEARRELHAFLELSPNYNSEMARASMPLRNDADFEH